MLPLWPLFLVGAYLLGSVPFAYLIGRFHGVDIRQHGSGNVGATNVLRVLGKPWGITCFILDFLKGFLPVLGAVLYVRANLGDIRPADALSPIAACAGAVSGHIWPVWLRFRGGKGMATSVGALLALAPLPVLLGVTAWVAVFKLSRYVSLASIIAVVVMPVAAALCLLFRAPGIVIREIALPTILFMTALAALVILKHGSNIARLLKGTENRFAPKAPSGK